MSRASSPATLTTALALVAATLLLTAAPAHAFIEESFEGGDVDLRGFLRTSATTSRNPGPTLIYGNDSDTTSLSILRLLSSAYLGEHLSLSFNGYQVITSTTSPLSRGAAGAPYGQWDGLDYHWNEDPQADAHLALEWLNVGITTEHVNVTIGRQPVNLATTFFFTPNDFFAPFSAQTFFRAYKLGVDSIRADVQLGDFTQLQLIGVLGYEPRESAADVPDLPASSAVARASTVLLDYEVGLLGGRVPGGLAAGGDLQGELGDAIGLRLAGHVFFDDDDRSTPVVEAALSLEHIFDGGTIMQWETFYHGAGATDPDDYIKALLDPAATRSPYLGRLYTGLATTYELTPLLNVTGLVLANVLDPSFYGSVNLLYSVSNEAELAVTGSVPLGQGIAGEGLALRPRSEFGLYPGSVGVDFRLTF